MFKDELQTEIDELNNAIEWAQQNLKRAPKGTLLIDTIKGKERYYYRTEPTQKKGIYLGKGNEEQIRALAQKDYETRLLRAAQEAKAALDKVWGQGKASTALGSSVLLTVYDNLPEARKALVEPYALSDDDYAQRWQQEEYVGNTHPMGSYSLFTHKGERVRSKSEVLIADALEAKGVPYKYEHSLNLGGYDSVYPDFTVLNKHTRAEYYWEHFGGMDDPDYREGMVHKLNRYALAGIMPGDKLLATWETAETPLDTRVVQAVINKFLL